MDFASIIKYNLHLGDRYLFGFLKEKISTILKRNGIPNLEDP
jgi:hypothetical protein